MTVTKKNSTTDRAPFRFTDCPYLGHPFLRQLVDVSDWAFYPPGVTFSGPDGFASEERNAAMERELFGPGPNSQIKGWTIEYDPKTREASGALVWKGEEDY